MNNELKKNQLGRDACIKHKNGAIFKMVKNDKNPNSVYLVSKRNKHTSYSGQSLKDGLGRGDWGEVGQDEFDKWNAEHQRFLGMLTERLLKRVIVAQLLLEIDESLMEFHEGDRYFQNTLQKSINQAERIAKKHFDNIYELDGDMIQNTMKIIEDHAGSIAKLNLLDFPFMAEHSKKYFKSPEKFRYNKIK